MEVIGKFVKSEFWNLCKNNRFWPSYSRAYFWSTMEKTNAKQNAWIHHRYFAGAQLKSFDCCTSDKGGRSSSRSIGSQFTREAIRVALAIVVFIVDSETNSSYYSHHCPLFSTNKTCQFLRVFTSSRLRTNRNINQHSSIGTTTRGKQT